MCHNTLVDKKTHIHLIRMRGSRLTESQAFSGPYESLKRGRVVMCWAQSAHPLLIEIRLTIYPLAPRFRRPWFCEWWFSPLSNEILFFFEKKQKTLKNYDLCWPWKSLLLTHKEMINLKKRWRKFSLQIS